MKIKQLIIFSLLFFSVYLIAQDAPPSEGVFRLKNVATGKFLTNTATSASPVTMSDSGESPNTHFRFVQSGSFYNIDSETLGILRFTGAGFASGAYAVVSTTKAAPAADGDKTWTISHNETNNTYRFGSRTAGRFITHNENGTVTHAIVPETDDRSNWELILYVQTPVEIAPDEETSTDLSCSTEFQNNSTRNVDIPNANNVGTADDRSCYSDYSESNVNGKTWGVYNITNGSNHWDGATLQPRIERSLPRSGETGIGSFARFTGTLRILEVGDTGSFSQSGTYIAQAKGKHSGGGGSRDPAICLYRAHPVYGTGINADKQVAFDIYAERILERGGEGSGREVVFLKRVNKNEEVDFELEVGFRQNPNDASKKVHYCDAVIGGEAFNYNIPSPERGLESGIRYGVYRVRGGRAQIRWTNTTYEKAEVKEENETLPPSDDIFRLRNVATGQFLTAVGSSAEPVVMTDSGEARNTHWTLVPSGDFFNIDSETVGILRAPGASFSQGAYRVVTTGKASPASDTDKTWTIYSNKADNTYRFESRTAGRFLYHNEDGTVTHAIASADDKRSKWEVIPTSQTLSITPNALNVTSLKVYPNPAKDVFTISLNTISKANIIIYNTLGKTVYKGSTLNGNLEIRNNKLLVQGLYMVKAISSDNKVYHSKLIIK